MSSFTYYHGNRTECFPILLPRNQSINISELLHKIDELGASEIAKDFVGKVTSKAYLLEAESFCLTITKGLPYCDIIEVARCHKRESGNLFELYLLPLFHRFVTFFPAFFFHAVEVFTHKLR